MQVIEVTREGESYAEDVQDAIFDVMKMYAETVGFESQIAIMGVAVGAILNQLSDGDREYYSRLFVENMAGAKDFAVVQMH